MERRRRPPCPVADARYRFTPVASACKRQGAAVARHDIAIAGLALDLHLDALERGIDISSRTASRIFLAENMPGLQSLTQLER